MGEKKCTNCDGSGWLQPLSYGEGGVPCHQCNSPEKRLEMRLDALEKKTRELDERTRGLVRFR